MTRRGYDIAAVYDDDACGTIGFIWRDRRGKWRALASACCDQCGTHCRQRRIGAFPDRVSAIAAILDSLEYSKPALNH